MTDNRPGARIEPFAGPYSDAVVEDFNAIMPPGMEPLNIFKTMAHSPRLMRKMRLGGLLDKGHISLRQRELVILRVCARCGAEYEWGVHVAGFAHKAGFSEAQIAATTHPQIDTDLWPPEESCLLEMTDQLHDGAQISDTLWSTLNRHYDREQLLELLLLNGLYHAVSFIVNGARVPLESYAPRFPA